MLKSITFGAFAVCFASGCHNDDPGFDIVKVPLSAYAPRDAAVDGADAHADGGHELIVVCIEKPESKDEGDDEKKVEKADDDCPLAYRDRNYDEKATERHHKNDSEANVCCYRRGRIAAPRTTPDSKDDENE